MTITVR